MWGVGLFHVPGMRKNFAGELGKQPDEIVVLFTISPRRQFEHALTAAPQLLGTTRRCHFRRLIRHLIHLSKKPTWRRLVPDISIAKSFHNLESEFSAFPFEAPARRIATMTIQIPNLSPRSRN